MSRASILKSRAEKLAQARAFFAQRGVMEVDVPALVKYPPNDAHIDVIRADGGYLHTSPEYAMKRLLSEGIGDCYFLGHVYRKNELGSRHNPEFTMVEWYRLGFTLEQMIQETCEFLFLFLGEKPIRTISYREAFERYAANEPPHPTWSHDESMHYLMSHKIEPNLGRGELTALIDYPPKEAALACVIEKNGDTVAERFEIYYEGVELANGYHELSDAEELRKRFSANNAGREEAYPLDEKFLDSLQKLPDCCGVALGFDRAFMLQQSRNSLKEVLPFSWDVL